jgi:phosphopantothenoylcysteine decarboxylase/phosphopantothenate--cysteine ligase
MGTLINKRVLLGITGGIAAYKSPDVVRRLREAGAEVRCVMTRAAGEFITALSLRAVSGQPVAQSLWPREAAPEEGATDAMEHIELARWADAVLIAPASADFLARLAQGRADDLLSTLCLAAEVPLAVAPAMNQIMWANPATQANIATLRARGVRIFGPASGSQACGEVGPGRMLEPADLAELTAGLFASGALDGRTVVVTAGPTWEALDPVRGLTNRSSGKMGYAVAAAAAEAGARVILVSGPTALADPERVQTVRVTSAQEMHDAVHERIRGADVFIGVAAVADYRPAEAAAQKIKKHADTLTLTLVKNPDILASVAALRPAPFMVGFAAETENLEAQARAKLEAKKLDLVAANLVGIEGSGFGADDNALLLVDRDGAQELPRAPKAQLARVLIREIARRLAAHPVHARARA